MRVQHCLSGFYHYLSTKQNPFHAKDIEFAQRLYRELESRGREPWLDWQEVPPFFSEGKRSNQGCRKC